MIPKFTSYSIFSDTLDVYLINENTREIQEIINILILMARLKYDFFQFFIQEERFHYLNFLLSNKLISIHSSCLELFYELLINIGPIVIPYIVNLKDQDNHSFLYWVFFQISNNDFNSKVNGLHFIATLLDLNSRDGGEQMPNIKNSILSYLNVPFFENIFDIIEVSNDSVTLDFFTIIFFALTHSEKMFQLPVLMEFLNNSDFHDILINFTESTDKEPRLLDMTHLLLDNFFSDSS